MSANEVLVLLKEVGPVVLVVVLLIARVLVTRAELDEMRKQRDDWKAAAELNQKIAESVLDQGGAAKELFAAMRRVAVEAGKVPDP